MDIDDGDTDEVLWSRACDEDAAAFAIVFDRHADAVYTHCARRAGSWTDAQDLTSLVFLEAWRRRDRVRFVAGSARPWLLTVSANLARNQARARRRYARVLARVPTEAHTPDIADEAVHATMTEQLATQVAACLQQLSPAEQDAVSLVDMGELTYDEAATALGIPVGTVRSRLSRARAKIRTLLTENTEPTAIQPQTTSQGDC